LDRPRRALPSAFDQDGYSRGNIVNITRNQWLQIIGVVIGACIAASSLWTQLFGATTSQVIVSLLGLSNTILAGITFILTGQSQQIRDVAAMPGIQAINVNAQANPTLASIAIDPSQSKVAPTADAKAAVTQIAKQ
jgi:hypothetical protein